VPPGQTRQVPVVVINDLDKEWQGTVRLQLLQRDRAVEEHSQPCRVPALGTQRLSFQVKVPGATGRYQLVGELVAPGQHTVRSLRDFAVLTEAERRAKEGLAKGKPVTASSSVTVGSEHYPATAAVDGDPSTRWSSEFSDPQWIAVDLGAPMRISCVELAWEGAYGKAYAIQVTLDGKTWKDVFKTEKGQGGIETVRVAPVEARWVRMHGTQRGTPFGYSLWEFKVFP